MTGASIFNWLPNTMATAIYQSNDKVCIKVFVLFYTLFGIKPQSKVLRYSFIVSLCEKRMQSDWISSQTKKMISIIRKTSNESDNKW